ncbi:MAG TPA: hypothetical protein VF120_00165 [Ktedonobacterales bacterium]
MVDSQKFWTGERIDRLEHTLQRYQNDTFAQAFLQRLSACSTQEQKRQLIVEELVPVLLHDSAVQLWEGREIPTRVPLPGIVQDFLHGEGVIENLPPNESDTPEEAAERERLARLFGQGKAASEIVIEDRGPR